MILIMDTMFKGVERVSQ